jgi:predicted transcriptional regulator YdeE
MMLPGLEDINTFDVMGTLTRVDADGSDLDEVWGAFEQHRDMLAKVSSGKAYYGVSFRTDDPEKVDYLAGMAVPTGTQPAEGMVIKTLPTALYAQFDCRFHELPGTIEEAHGEWLPSSPYAPDNKAEVTNYLRLPPGELNPQAMVSYFFPILE